VTHFTYNRLLIVLIILGLLAAAAVGWQRHKVEENNSTVELIMGYEDIVELAQIAGVPPLRLMGQFKDAGITSLAVYELTLEKLNKSGKATVLSGASLLQQSQTGALNDPFWRNLAAAGGIRADDVYVIGRDKDSFAEIKSDLMRRLGPGRVAVLAEGDRPVLAVKANYEKVLKENLGLSATEIKAVVAQGFYVVPRPSNYMKVTAPDVNAVLERLNVVPQDKISAIVFAGDEVLGYPDLLSLTAGQMKDRGFTLGMIEHPLQLQFVNQEGLTDLAAAIQYRAARLYSIPQAEQPKLKMADAVQRWVIANQERNIRLNLLRRYDKPASGKTLIETNLQYVSGVKQALLDNHFTVGRAGTYPPYFASRWLLAVIILGSAAAGVLLLSLIHPFPARRQYLLTAVIAALLIFPVLSGGGDTARQGAALASAICFPVLSMTWQIDRWRRREASGNLEASAGIRNIVVQGSGALVITTLLSLVGGLYIGALLSDVRFLLEMEIFRGVKLVFVAPLVLITLVYLTRYNLFEPTGPTGSKSLWRQLTAIWEHPVTIKVLALFGAAAVAAWVYVGRSGHTAGIPVPAIELKLRTFLEQVMYARPRTKEFMIGHPAFLLAAMALYRQWPRVVQCGFVVLAMIAQGSLVGTFAHLRTPVFMSFMRALDGLALGVIGGLTAIAGLCLVSALVTKHTLRKKRVER